MWVYREGVGAERSGGGLGKFTIAGRVVGVEGNAVVDAELTWGSGRLMRCRVEGWKIVSGAEIEAGESVTIVVNHS
jgi:hypothetical protein